MASFFGCHFRRLYLMNILSFPHPVWLAVVGIAAPPLASAAGEVVATRVFKPRAAGGPAPNEMRERGPSLLMRNSAASSRQILRHKSLPIKQLCATGVEVGRLFAGPKTGKLQGSDFFLFWPHFGRFLIGRWKGLALVH